MKNVFLAVMCVALFPFGVGCQQQQRTDALDQPLRGEAGQVQDPITVDTVTRDMSPELTTRAETRDERRVRTARVIDTNTRTIWDDLRNIFLLDRPSRLTMYPTP